jgi:XisH protein
MARDIIHQAVKNALIKDGWVIANDPLYIRSGGVEVEIDLAAEKFLIAEKDTIKILVEVKSMYTTELLKL